MGNPMRRILLVTTILPSLLAVAIPAGADSINTYNLDAWVWAGQHQVLVFRNDKRAAFMAFSCFGPQSIQVPMPAETDISAGSIVHIDGKSCAVTLVERNPEVLTKVAAELPQADLSTEPGKGERDIAVEVQVQEQQNPKE